MSPVPPFTLIIKHGFKTARCRVRQILLTERIEQFKIGSDKKYIIIETNRPFFRNKGLKKRMPDVKLIYGLTPFGTTYDKIVNDILTVADGL